MRVDQLEREFAIDVTWQPFELHPEIPAAGKDLSGRDASYYDRLVGLATDAGLDFKPPRRVSNSHASLEAAEFAREQGAFAPFHRDLFAAYFGEQRDIGDHEVLADIAATNGIDAGGLREALATKRYSALVDNRTDNARRSGVTGTPTFIFDDGERHFALVGAQEYAVFQSVAQRMGAESRPA